MNPALAFDVMDPACPSRTVLRRLTDRWTPLIVTVLSGGSRRFGQVRDEVGGITAKVLTQTLRSMERDGLVTRSITASVPARVDYELTELGRSLIEPIQVLRGWAEAHASQVLDARASWDGA
ncbi:Transcriptional regulator [Acidipropionibacterium acidipropionici ATCC 4875]|uniref:Transcriptional regulator n=1 Tax=Acidipropionibacterium acidipropionici (strain ATCC 4875 / DSM 20272 / JCM 6432 / NBRC 12425 / NCIMB 8070 / 4) TaxID=1171373 RepID=K7S9A4_ACIA4|nr:helix-turn-helix domain-containing protein [Acidipropionibacterium acidipropionici]AFV91142.1 Transcriptional regulator [Acidipropionibacterium acidipropionici ATCC 4875]